MARILVIDDEPQIRRFLTISLGSQGYIVLEAGDGSSGLHTAALEEPDLIILDLGLPDMDGHEVLKALRDFYKRPIIVLSVRDSERDKVAALDAGCNDYVQKPFGVKELLARIRSVLRTFSDLDPPPINYDDGQLVVDIFSHRVKLHDKDIHLSKKEFELLHLFIAHPGRIMTQQYLLREIWGASHADDTHYLRVFIGRLRSKLGDDPTNPQYIETEAGVGYRFLGNNSRR
jgi:two-component system KDP operon response regulator KdpE